MWNRITYAARRRGQTPVVEELESRQVPTGLFPLALTSPTLVVQASEAPLLGVVENNSGAADGLLSLESLALDLRLEARLSSAGEGSGPLSNQARVGLQFGSSGGDVTIDLGLRAGDPEVDLDVSDGEMAFSGSGAHGGDAGNPDPGTGFGLAGGMAGGQAAADGLLDQASGDSDAGRLRPAPTFFWLDTLNTAVPQQGLPSSQFTRTKEWEHTAAQKLPPGLFSSAHEEEDEPESEFPKAPATTASVTAEPTTPQFIEGAGVTEEPEVIQRSAGPRALPPEAPGSLADFIPFALARWEKSVQQSVDQEGDFDTQGGLDVTSWVLALAAAALVYEAAWRKQQPVVTGNAVSGNPDGLPPV